MNTAATAANTHLTKEKAETVSKASDRDTASTNYTNSNNLIANLSSLYTSAKSTYDTKKTEWDTKLQEKADAAAIKSKINTELGLAAAALLTATSGSVAKTLQTETATLGNKLTDLNNASTAWAVEAKK